jgi:methenyltetrahydrofolate cyclohydrolase
MIFIVVAIIVHRRTHQENYVTILMRGWDHSLAEKTTIRESTLAAFRERVADAEQISTGVSVAAVSAALGASLLQMVLELMAKRPAFAGDVRQLASLRRAAQHASERLMLHADADIAAYLAYMNARRMKADAAEIARCQRRTVEVPLEAARSALAALRLCAEAAGIVSGAITADLSTAAILLQGAVRSMTLCIAENVRQVADGQAKAQCAAMEEEACQVLNAVVLRPHE